MEPPRPVTLHHSDFVPVELRRDEVHVWWWSSDTPGEPERDVRRRQTVQRFVADEGFRLATVFDLYDRVHPG